MVYKLSVKVMHKMTDHFNYRNSRNGVFRINTHLVLIASLLLNIVCFITINGQSKQMKILREENKKLRSNESDDELVALAKEKLKTMGEIKTIKYLRIEKGMSMLEAKQFVDSLKEDT